LTLLGCTAFDYISTKRKLETGRFHEGNPALRSKDGFNDTVFIGVNVLGYVATLILENKRPKLASWIRFGVSGAHCVGGAWNASQ
jgi:hypothetical protein